MCLQRLAVVIAVDIADLRKEQQFLNGAAAVAILLGQDAPLVLDSLRGSHMINTLDFYKPVVISPSSTLASHCQVLLAVFTFTCLPFAGMG